MKTTNKKTKIAAAAMCAAMCVGSVAGLTACAHTHSYGDWKVTAVSDARVTIARTCSGCSEAETKNISALANTNVWTANKTDGTANVKYTNSEYGLTYYDWAMEFESAAEGDEGFVRCSEYSNGYFAALCVQLSGGDGISATSQNATLSGTITFIFTAKEAGKATLKLSAASDVQADTQDHTEDYRVSPETGVRVKINNADYAYTPDTIPGNDSADYDPSTEAMFELMDPHTITLGEIDLKKGTNQITFIFDGECHLHLDCIHLLTDVDGSHQLGYIQE